MVVRSWLDGWRRVAGAPAVVAGVFVLTFVLALPLALALHGLLQAHLGRSLMAGPAAEGVNYDWWQEFSSQATGLGTTFTPRIIGFAATLDSMSSLLDAQWKIVPIATVLAAYLALWTFLAGGILDRYARQRPTRAHGFFAASGVFFFRFVRLALVAGAVYWWLFAYVHVWLFDEWYRWMIHDNSVERVALLWRIAMYVAFGTALLLVNILFDYAKIRIVVEDRRSVLGALSAALRFCRRHPRRVFLLYGVNSATFLIVIAAWALMAPGVTDAGSLMLVAFLVGQVYVIVRLALKLHFLASQTALFQESLAHAGYTAAPAATWPDSPTAETIAPAAKQFALR